MEKYGKADFVLVLKEYSQCLAVSNNHPLLFTICSWTLLTSILIVDDARFMRTMLRNIIESAKLATNVVEAIDNTSAIEMYKKVKPNLVTMDINLPITDGITCMKEILKIDPLANVLMVSSVEQKDIIDNALSSGAKGYIKKPFDKNEIVSTLKKLLI